MPGKHRITFAAGAAIVAALLPTPNQGRLAAADSSCELTGVERIVAIGDVHGSYDRLVGILQAVGLIDARQRWTGGKAHLVQLGDAE